MVCREVASADIESEVRLRWPVWALGASRWNATADVGSDHPLHEPVSMVTWTVTWWVRGRYVAGTWSRTRRRNRWRDETGGAGSFL